MVMGNFFLSCDFFYIRTLLRWHQKGHLMKKNSNLYYRSLHKLESQCERLHEYFHPYKTGFRFFTCTMGCLHLFACSNNDLPPPCIKVSHS